VSEISPRLIERVLAKLGFEVEPDIDRAGLERGHRVAVVGGGEDDVAASAGRTRHVQTAAPRHADVEERDLGRERLDCFHRGRPMLALGDDLQLGPGRGQHAAQLGVGHLLAALNDQVALARHRLEAHLPPPVPVGVRETHDGLSRHFEIAQDALVHQRHALRGHAFIVKRVVAE